MANRTISCSQQDSYGNTLLDYPLVKNAVEATASQLTNRTTGSFTTIHHGAINTDIDDYSTEDEYLEAVAYELDSEIGLQHGDSILTGDMKGEQGWGRSNTISMAYITVHSARVYIGELAANYAVEQMGMHELGHGYGAAHHDGHFDFRDEGGTTYYTVITPIVSSYVRNRDDTECDFQFCAISNPPSEVCGGLKNYSAEFDGVSPKSDHTQRLSGCSINEVQNWVDINGI